MKDFLDNDIKINDSVIYMDLSRDDRFKKFKKGTVIEITDKFIKIKTKTGKIIKRMPHRVIINNSDMWKDKYLYLAAEFDNYKKHTNNKIQIEVELNKNKILNTLLTTLDNLEMSYEHTKDDGIKIIINDIYNKLKVDYNIITIDEYLKDKKDYVDTNYHEIVSMLSDNTKENNVILSSVQKGFVYNNGKLVRIQKVVVNHLDNDLI